MFVKAETDKCTEQICCSRVLIGGCRFFCRRPMFSGDFVVGVVLVFFLAVVSFTVIGVRRFLSIRSCFASLASGLVFLLACLRSVASLCGRRIFSPFAILTVYILLDWCCCVSF